MFVLQRASAMWREPVKRLFDIECQWTKLEWASQNNSFTRSHISIMIETENPFNFCIIMNVKRCVFTQKFVTNKV